MASQLKSFVLKCNKCGSGNVKMRIEDIEAGYLVSLQCVKCENKEDVVFRDYHYVKEKKWSW